VPVNKNNKKLMPGCPIFAFSAEASPMATNDPIPLFLSDHPEEHDQPGIAKDRAVLSSRTVKTSILIVTAAAIVFAILSVGNPLVLFENATASLFARSAPQNGTGQSMPIIQSTADTQPLPPTASEAPRGDEMATTLKTADQSQTEIRLPSAEVLLNQFQAWAGEEDALAQVRPVQPVQDAQAQVVQIAPEQVRPVQKQRQVRPVQNVRAKIVKNARAQLRRERNRAQVRPEQNPQAQNRSVQNAQAQDRSAQDAQAPRLLQSLGWRN
jgi:flagellar biosynthesis GTPase FlhF